MTHQSIINQSSKVYLYLAQKQLKDAFDTLYDIIEQHKLLTYKTKLEELQITYKYMLQYTVANANDPERAKVYDKLFVDTYILSNNIEQGLLNEYSNKLPYSQNREKSEISLKHSVAQLRRATKQRNAALESLASHTPYDVKIKYQKHFTEIFQQFWSLSSYTADMVSFAKDMVNNPIMKDYEQAAIVSAITLSLWRDFDPHKFDALFELSTSSSELVRQRAFVGIIMAIYVYNDRLSVFSNITARFTLLAENPAFIKAIENTIIQFIRSKESEKIAKQFNEEIIPEMIKLSPQMRDKLNFSKTDHIQDGEDDKNPDWKELLDEVPGLTDKMKKISEMQMEGADVFLSTFSMLKTFPFFNQLHNWLMPFNPSYLDVEELGNTDENKPFVTAISKSRFMCNSDKYSFLLSMQQLPTAQKAQMSSAIGVDFEGMKEIEKDETSLNKDRKAEFISNQYIQDLYRLFNLHPRKHNFENIFKQSLDFHNKTAIARLIEDDKIWHNIAEYYFGKNYFREAAELYDNLLDKDQANAEMLQKRGYCAQKQNLYQEALDFYLKADLVDSNNTWTIKKIAHCYRATNDVEKALTYYKQATSLQPNNMAVQLSIGHCYLSLKNYPEALNTYFKIELGSKNTKKSWRPIAWCSFISKKIEQAQKYYIKILEHQPTPHDYINAGHVQLALHNSTQAIELYKQGISGLGNDIRKFLKIFDEDKIYLLSYNVDPSDLPILIDKLRYDLD